MCRAETFVRCGLHVCHVVPIGHDPGLARSSHELEVWILPDRGGDAPQKGERLQSMPLSHEVVRWGGQKPAALNRCSPRAAADLVKCLSVGEDPLASMRELEFRCR